MQSINITEATDGWAAEFDLWVSDLNALGYEHSMLQPLTAVRVQRWQMSLSRSVRGNEWKASAPFTAAKQPIFKCSWELHPSTACWYTS